ncbi:MAG: hypothetical protein IPL72_17330 [Sulfuritalea sp.]|nr:hypothetical protein [Sulfuritalea sp.]
MAATGKSWPRPSTFRVIAASVPAARASGCSTGVLLPVRRALACSANSAAATSAALRPQQAGVEPDRQ